MSKETVQFTEMVRQGQQASKTGPEKRFKRTFDMYCELCNSYQPHQFRTSNGWEHYTCCRCGHPQDFRVG